MTSSLIVNEALEAAQRALNEIPNKRLHGPQKDTYEVARMVDQAIKTVAQEKINLVPQDVLASLNELLEICRSKCSPHDEVILPNGRTNHEALVKATAIVSLFGSSEQPTTKNQPTDLADEVIDALKEAQVRLTQAAIKLQGFAKKGTPEEMVNQCCVWAAKRASNVMAKVEAGRESMLVIQAEAAIKATKQSLELVNRIAFIAGIENFTTGVSREDVELFTAWAEEYPKDHPIESDENLILFVNEKIETARSEMGGAKL